LTLAKAHPTLRWQDLGWPRPEWATLTDDGKFHYTYNARAALYQLLRAMPRNGREIILLPAYHCATVVEPVLQAGWKVRFYRIRLDLSIDLDDLKQRLSNDVAAILVIHFFGFSAPLNDILRLRQQFGCYVIEDWAHSFLQGPNVHVPGEDGDFALLSFYKHAPCFAGGGLRVNTPVSWWIAPQQKTSWQQSAFITKRLIEQAIDNAPSGLAKHIFQEIEQWRVRNKDVMRQISSGPSPKPAQEFSEKLAMSSIPWLSRKVLEAAPWSTIYLARRHNYESLARRLEENPFLRIIFPRLPPNVCPWAFPVWLPFRSEHDVQLRAAGVPLFTFGEVLHPAIEQCDGPTRDDAESLSKHLLLLSVHQNLGSQDMERIAKLMNNFYRGRT
jgi:perosamine synthetase